jgi:3-(3-hydroxy-phenyl)propionate hydroxylase
MEFKPRPTFDEGFLHGGKRRRGRFDGAPGVWPAHPEGTLFPQPMVLDAAGARRRLDELLGPGFAVVGMGVEPRRAASRSAFWEGLDARFVHVLPEGSTATEGAVVDEGGALGAWFGRYGASLAIVRPDRYVYGGFGRGEAARIEEELRQALA